MRYVLILAVCLAVGCSSKKVPITATSKTDLPTVAKEDPPKKKSEYKRDEFRKLVDGKTPAQLIELVGRPSLTKKTGGKVSPEDITWVYTAKEVKVVDSDSGKADREVRLVIFPQFHRDDREGKNNVGKVYEVEFVP